MHEDEIAIDETLVRELLEAQMPELADRELSIVEPWGTDNAIWRLGEDLIVRLPRIHWAASQADREAEVLTRIASYLSMTVPVPVAVGEPRGAYPYRWAVLSWLPGESAGPARIDDPISFALDLADFVRALEAIPTDGAPPATGRARPLAEYNDSTLEYIEGASHLIDAAAARNVWQEALAAPAHEGAPLWVHSDLEGNCIVNVGRLSGVVDWAYACGGDPAVDVQVVWSPLFTEASRRAFIDALQVDDATLARSRGAAIQQACGALPYYLDTYPLIVERSWHKLAALGVQPVNR